MKIWKMTNLTPERKIFIFKTVAVSKIVFQSSITIVPKHIVNGLEKIQKAFCLNNSTPKIKHETLCNNYKARGLKDVDIPNQFQVYDNSFHDWKLIPLQLIEKLFGTSFKFTL